MKCALGIFEIWIIRIARSFGNHVARAARTENLCYRFQENVFRYEWPQMNTNEGMENRQVMVLPNHLFLFVDIGVYS